MKDIRAIGAALMFSLSVSANAIDFNQLDWRESVTRDNLTIELAPVEGQSIKAFRATSVYNATLEQMVGIITDMSTFSKWVHGAEEAHVIKKLDHRSQACYYVNAIPWPLKNRDGVIVQTLERVDDNTVRINLSTMNELAEENPKYVRIRQLEGAWVLKRLNAQQVELTYLMHLDPTGNIPSPIVNLMLTETPEKTLSNLHKMNLSHYNDSIAGLALE